MRVLFDYYIFLNQKYGGVSRYFVELYKQFFMMDDVAIDIPIKFSMNQYLETEGKRLKNVPDSMIDKSFYMKMYAYINQKVLNGDIRKNGCDILHPTWYSPYVYKLSGNQKIVCTVHDMIQELFWKDKDVRTIERKKEAIYKSDAIIVVSENTKNDILKIYPDINEKKITVVHSGVNKLVDSNEMLDDNKAIDAWLPKDYILFVGKREDYKNGMFVINALKDLLKLRDIHLIYIGGGAFSSEERKIVHDSGIEYLIHQRNVEDRELAYLYRKAICFIYPTKYEGFGFPILEAFDNNCPVICTNSSSLPEVAGDAALYFEEGNAEECNNKVNLLIDDNELRNTLIKRGTNQVQKFSWKISAHKTLDVYRNIL